MSAPRFCAVMGCRRRPGPRSAPLPGTCREHAEERIADQIAESGQAPGQCQHRVPGKGFVCDRPRTRGYLVCPAHSAAAHDGQGAAAAAPEVRS